MMALVNELLATCAGGVLITFAVLVLANNLNAFARALFATIRTAFPKWEGWD